MVILPAGPDAAAPDATPPDAPSPPDAAPPDAAIDALPPDAVPPPDGPPCTFELDFTAMEDRVGDTITVGGVSLQATLLFVRSGLGLGVDGGGPSDEHVDGSEVLDIVFMSPPGAIDIRYTVADATDGDMDVGRGEHLLRAHFLSGGQDEAHVNGEGTFALDAILEPRDRIAGVTVEARDGDGIRISRLIYSLCEQ